MATRVPQLIRVNAEQVVLKHGVQELLVSGPEAVDLATRLVAELRQAPSLDGYVPDVPESLRPAADQLLRTLRSRRLIAETPAEATDPRPTPAEAFFETLDADPAPMRARLESAVVTLVGVNHTTRSLGGSLQRAGVGMVQAFAHPVLDNHDLADDDPAHVPSSASGQPASDLSASDRTASNLSASDRSASNLTASILSASDLLVAGCDFGPADALLAMSRLAIAADRPFLPVWLADRQGFIGPLGVPHETGCLRCYLDQSPAPAGSGSPTIELRWQPPDETASAQESSATRTAAAVGGNVAAMEVIKFLTGCAPSAVVGRSVRVDSESLALSTRRVWKRPRCPDCSEIARHRIPSVLKGPQIPNR